MKYLSIVFLFFWVLSATAANPITSCPTGYMAITESSLVTIATSCPSGTTSVGAITSCLANSSSVECYMFAPVGMSFTDDSGTYEYAEVCVLQ